MEAGDSYKYMRQQRGVQEKKLEQNQATRSTRCVVRNEKDHSLQAAGGSDGWKSE